jgi:hypothetical protein
MDAGGDDDGRTGARADPLSDQARQVLRNAHAGMIAVTDQDSPRTEVLDCLHQEAGAAVRQHP